MRVEAGTKRVRRTTTSPELEQTKTARGGFAIYYSRKTAIQELRFWRSIFLAGFAWGFLETFVVASQPFWVIEFFKPSTQAAFNSISEGFTITSLLIDPVAVFSAMFLVGRRFGMSLGFGSTLLSLLTGTIFGTYACLAALSAYSTSVGLWQPFQAQVELDLVYDSLGAFRLALVSFSGLALAHLTRIRTLSSNQGSAQSIKAAAQEG